MSDTKFTTGKWQVDILKICPFPFLVVLILLRETTVEAKQLAEVRT